MKNSSLYFSLAINLIILISLVIFIYNKGGLSYLKNKLNADRSAINLYALKVDIYNNMPDSNGDIFFIGNSLIELCDWAELFKNPKIKNRGISHDVIDGLIDRLDNIINAKPSKVFIMIGTNDLARGKTVDDIINGYKKIIRKIESGSPSTKIYIHSVLPAIDRSNRSNKTITEINGKLKKLALEMEFTYVDLYSKFSTSTGQLNPKFTFDGLHLNGEGYKLWQEIIEIYLNE